MYLLNKELASSILIIDLDVHQGNGTAQIFENEPRVFTFSMHAANNFPFRKETSDLDIPLPDGIIGKEYLDILYDTLPKLIAQHKPGFIFFQAYCLSFFIFFRLPFFDLYMLISSTT